MTISHTIGDHSPHMSSASTADRAVCLEYDGQTAPILTAAGEAEWAEAIIKTAQKHGIPIYENTALVNFLSQLELGEEIPRDLYLVIAQIIAFVYHLKGQQPER